MTINFKTVLAVLATSVSLTALHGCAVTRDQTTVGEYIADSEITTKVKAKFVEAKSVDATSIKVETLNGTVLLSGFAKNAAEKADAESIARGVKGVRSVDNRIVMRS